MNIRFLELLRFATYKDCRVPITQYLSALNSLAIVQGFQHSHFLIILQAGVVFEVSLNINGEDNSVVVVVSYVTRHFASEDEIGEIDLFLKFILALNYVFVVFATGQENGIR
jgi:hypothetical protein